jgi:hypothetical protein
LMLNQTFLTLFRTLIGMAQSKHQHPIQTESIVPSSDTEMIQYVGLRDLDEQEREAIQEIATKYHDKIKRKTKNDTRLMLHIKVHGAHKDKCHGEDHDADKKIKYGVHLKVVSPMHIFESEDSDFDIRKAANMVFEHMLNQIEHKFHDNQGVASRLLAPGQSRKTAGKDD